MRTRSTRTLSSIPHRPLTLTPLPRFNSSSAPSPSDPGPSFQPSLPQGQNPAYDAALSFLSSHQSKLSSRLQTLKSTNPNSTEIPHLEISSLINDPSTRRAFASTKGKGMMDQPVMRHLAERSWRKEGGLDLLMQRVHQLGVVPDLLPELKGSMPLIIHGKEGIVEPGSIQSPSGWDKPPKATLQLFGKEGEGKYTLIVVDTDHPSSETQSFVQRILYLKSDIKLDVTSGEVDLFQAEGKEELGWEPPLPAKGTGKHRYVFIVLRQPSSSSSSPSSSSDTSSSSSQSLSEVEERSPFNLRTHLSTSSLSPADITAINLIRSEHTSSEAQYLSEKYREIHGGEMVEYGKPPKEMRFGYPMSANQKRTEKVREEAWDRAVGGLVGELEGEGVEVIRGAKE